MEPVLQHRFGRRGVPIFIAAVMASVVACGGSRTTTPNETIGPAGTSIPSGGGTPSAVPPTTVVQAPTFAATDAPSDCFNGFGEPDDCAGLDLLGVDVGLQEAVLEIANEPGLPVVFVVSFADPPATAEEFGLYLYLDLDQNPATGLDMSSGPVALPGIDRLIGATLPDGDTWTQAVANGGYEAEIIRDPAFVSSRVDGNRIVVTVGRALLDEHTLAARRDGPVGIGRTLVGTAAGGTPDAFTLYVGTARSIDALDYFNGDQGIQVPLAMTVPEEVSYPPGPAGGS